MNNQASALHEHPPAQLVGGKRVKQAARRTSLTNNKTSSSSDEHDSSEEDQQQMDEMERRKQEQIRVENAMRSQHSARDKNVSRNAGSHVNARSDQAFQPRDLNH